MSTVPTLPDTEPELNDEMKRVLDRHVEAAEQDKEFIPARQVIDEGRAKLAKLKHPDLH